MSEIEQIITDLQYTLDQGDDETWTSTDWMNWSAATEPHKVIALMSALKAAKTYRRDDVAMFALPSVLVLCRSDSWKTLGAASFEEYCARKSYELADAMEAVRDGDERTDPLTEFLFRLKAKATKEGFLSIEQMDEVFNDFLRVPGGEV